jgi:AraC family transcriptional regulator, ethanolamine operon transcriptional activator
VDGEISEGGGVAGSLDLAGVSAVLRVCEADVVLLGAAGLQGEVVAQWSGDGALITGCYGFSLRASFTLPDDTSLVAYIHDTGPQSWCHGVGLEPGSAITMLPNGSGELLLVAGCRWTLMLLPAATLRAEFAALSPDQPQPTAHRLRMFIASGVGESRSLGSGYDKLRARLESGDPAGHMVAPLLRQHLMATLTATAEDRPIPSRGRRAHYVTLRRVEDFMRANLRRDIYIQELCNAAGSSERALRYAFDDLVGIPPNRYLSLLRLCAAYRSLRQADASRRSVKSVALSCGMWDLSRFAEHYRHTFGELPRSTLVRGQQEELAGH